MKVALSLERLSELLGVTVTEVSLSMGYEVDASGHRVRLGLECDRELLTADELVENGAYVCDGCDDERATKRGSGGLLLCAGCYDAACLDDGRSVPR